MRTWRNCSVVETLLNAPQRSWSSRQRCTTPRSYVVHKRMEVWSTFTHPLHRDSVFVNNSPKLALEIDTQLLLHVSGHAELSFQLHALLRGVQGTSESVAHDGLSPCFLLLKERHGKQQRKTSVFATRAQIWCQIARRARTSTVGPVT